MGYHIYGGGGAEHDLPIQKGVNVTEVVIVVVLVVVVIGAMLLGRRGGGSGGG